MKHKTTSRTTFNKKKAPAKMATRKDEPKKVADKPAVQPKPVEPAQDPVIEVPQTPEPAPHSPVITQAGHHEVVQS